VDAGEAVRQRTRPFPPIGQRVHVDAPPDDVVARLAGRSCNGRIQSLYTRQGSPPRWVHAGWSCWRCWTYWPPIWAGDRDSNQVEASDVT
jgi:hypothetical protein